MIYGRGRPMCLPNYGQVAGAPTIKLITNQIPLITIKKKIFGETPDPKY